MANSNGSGPRNHVRGILALAWAWLVVMPNVVPAMAKAAGTFSTKGSFVYRTPRHLVKTDGGSLSLWSAAFEELTKHGAYILAAEVTLEQNTLGLPSYLNSPRIVYVLEGSAYIGVMTPFGAPAAIRKISEGDVVVIPHGWVFWACNHQEKRFRAFAVADMTEHAGLPLNESSFRLAGSMKGTGKGWRQGSILHGFTKDVLAKVWDVEEADVEKLRDSQRESVIVKVSREAAEANVTAELSAAGCIGGFVYNLKNSEPDVTNDGGEFRLLNRKKLPTLHKFGVNFAIAYGKLNKGAIGAPGWSANGHQVAYITKGSGRFQIANPDGSNALDARVRAGSVIVIPHFHPGVVLASEEEELEYVIVVTSSLPVWVSMAGKDSVFQNMPEAVVKEAFNIPEDLLKKLRHRRTEYSFILPPPSTSGKKQHDQEEHEGLLRRSFM